MTELRPLDRSTLAWPGYLIAATLVSYPTVDTAMTVYPPNVGGVAWRFATVGIVSGGLLTPMLGLFVALTLAVVLEHRLALSLIGITATLLGVALLVAAPLFALDSVQMQSQLSPEAVTRVQATWIVAEIKLAGFAVAAFLIAVGAWRSARRGGEALDVPSASPRATGRPAPFESSRPAE